MVNNQNNGVKNSCNSSCLVLIDFHSFPSLVFSFLHDKVTLSNSAVSSSVQVKYSLSVLLSELTCSSLDAILRWVKKRSTYEETVKHWKMSQTSFFYQFHLNRTKLSHGAVWRECPVEIFGRSKTRPIPCKRSLSIPTQKIHKIQNQRSFPTEELRNVLKEVDYLHQKAREKIPKLKQMERKIKNKMRNSKKNWTICPSVTSSCVTMSMKSSKRIKCSKTQER